MVFLRVCKSLQVKQKNEISLFVNLAHPLKPTNIRIDYQTDVFLIRTVSDFQTYSVTDAKLWISLSSSMRATYPLLRLFLFKFLTQSNFWLIM